MIQILNVIIQFLNTNSGIVMTALTAAYVFCTMGILRATKRSVKVASDQADKAREAGIRPLVIGTRLSDNGEVGIYAGREGMNREISLINVGCGHAHRVNIRVSPPAEAYAICEDGQSLQEGQNHVIHQVELPVNAKRMWNDRGAFCNKGKWRCMYAEYEDLEGNQYYTVQSGYSVKTGNLSELGRNRKPDNDEFWEQKEVDLPAQLDDNLRQWVADQEQIYLDRRK